MICSKVKTPFREYREGVFLGVPERQSLVQSLPCCNFVFRDFLITNTLDVYYGLGVPIRQDFQINDLGLEFVGWEGVLSVHRVSLQDINIVFF